MIISQQVQQPPLPLPLPLSSQQEHQPSSVLGRHNSSAGFSTLHLAGGPQNVDQLRPSQAEVAGDMDVRMEASWAATYSEAQPHISSLSPTPHTSVPLQQPFASGEVYTQRRYSLPPQLSVQPPPQPMQQQQCISHAPHSLTSQQSTEHVTVGLGPAKPGISRNLHCREQPAQSDQLANTFRGQQQQSKHTPCQPNKALPTSNLFPGMAPMIGLDTPTVPPPVMRRQSGGQLGSGAAGSSGMNHGMGGSNGGKGGARRRASTGLVDGPIRAGQDYDDPMQQHGDQPLVRLEQRERAISSSVHPASSNFSDGLAQKTKEVQRLQGDGPAAQMHQDAADDDADARHLQGQVRVHMFKGVHEQPAMLWNVLLIVELLVALTLTLLS